FADELRSLVHLIRRERNLAKKKWLVLNTERPLVVYYGQGYLMKSAALEHQLRYEEAEEYIEGYADLSWFEELDELGRIEVDKFKLFAQANRYNIQLLAGNFSLLSEYASFLEVHPKEILPSMVIILKASNKHKMIIDDVLKQFMDNIVDGRTQKTYYNEANYISRYNEFYYQLATYQFSHNHNMEGIESTLQSLNISVQQGNKSKILDCICMFQQYKKMATPAQYTEYDTLIKGVNRDEESHSLSGFSTLPE
ncbi:MAG: DNA-binding protein, partial [Gorillibacterium sp.]|nr:DNA-binding protein [Gorillibacterium sp.]